MPHFSWFPEGLDHLFTQNHARLRACGARAVPTPVELYEGLSVVRPVRNPAVGARGGLDFVDRELQRTSLDHPRTNAHWFCSIFAHNLGAARNSTPTHKNNYDDQFPFYIRIRERGSPRCVQQRVEEETMAPI